MWLTRDFVVGYKCLISHFSPSNVDIIDLYFYMSFLNVYYITLCRLHELFLIISEVKIDKCVIQDLLHLQWLIILQTYPYQPTYLPTRLVLCMYLLLGTYLPIKQVVHTNLPTTYLVPPLGVTYLLPTKLGTY
jgi:hypothetical protein